MVSKKVIIAESIPQNLEHIEEYFVSNLSTDLENFH
jgi:hypothetical protein